jgi:putative pyruvate formate lyase activating enzyme
MYNPRSDSRYNSIMSTALLQSCILCGHRCRADRLAGELGQCRAGAGLKISSHCLHHGEEPPISGRRGSGTIFFAGCCLQCVYCQNYEISQGDGQGQRKANEVGAVVDIMLELQAEGAHNINLVSPTHYGAQLIAVLQDAKRQGLKLPIVYNSGGYDSLELLQALDGLIDIYLPDFKYWDDDRALKYSRAENYPAVARQGIAEMFRQVGNLEGVGSSGIGSRGILVRHLVLPNNLANSLAILDFLASLSKDIWVSLMAQYSPQHRAAEFPELNKKLLPAEYQRVVAHAAKIGLHNLYVQELSSSDVYLPDFQKDDPFFYGVGGAESAS